ncbi:MAG TPA: PEP-CTERM sorting domain-containing protein [Fimbriimonadaceae bacterium]|nr:PEP-CTERM sorting domain-containing protein [Fimbriimonadaceae bacterium]
MHSIRNLTLALAFAGLTLSVRAQTQLEWFITLGPGNSGNSAGTGYADRLNGQNVVIDQTSTVSQGPTGVGATHVMNFSVWIRNNGTTAVSTVGTTTSNTLVGIDRSDGFGMGRTQCLLPVGATGPISGGTGLYGAWGYNATIAGVGQVAWSAGAGLSSSALRPWGYDVSLNNTVSFSIAAGADVRLFNFTIKNNTLGNGGATAADPCPICIWDAGTGSSDTTLFRQSSTTTNYRPGGNTSSSTGNNNAQGSYACFNVVPEPGTMLALAAGLGGLLARRRRR